MRAGDLDRQIVIEREQITGDDGYGNEIRGWAPVATVWANVKQESGREFFAQSAVQNERRVVFRIRWLEVKTDDRVMYEGREHNIHDVRELGRREGIELHTAARV
ncbi:phage head closure protein [Aureimonas frigidaquae]|uniref:Phage head-tail adaptor n=1 Tax=Aureimonas frigidaquae TaxID=424757 RepID=A0A0P0Z3R9_9HYPH|nr:phage head closure protein [Aureimonas frigidaquae]BAT28733.1 phage head-tail adaptor [Aureimonas frigidaquae]